MVESKSNKAELTKVAADIVGILDGKSEDSVENIIAIVDEYIYNTEQEEAGKERGGDCTVVTSVVCATREDVI
jgi:hypothetical protein